MAESDRSLAAASGGWRTWSLSGWSKRSYVLALLGLCLAVYLPGVLRLPAVDRTEVIYAETTREMVAKGDWLNPRYGDTVHQFRPIGTYWAQGVAATIAGEGQARNISVYRLPGMVAVTLAVLALFLLVQPLIGSLAAFTAAALFAVAPLTVLVAHLAISESLSLLPAMVVMLALLRIYTAGDDDETRGLALTFWVALGFGVLVNALLVPIIVAVTLIALRFFDKDFWWLERLHTARFFWIALLIAAPWLAVRFYQDGVAFSGLSFGGFIEALGGAQDMKLRAMPGTFVLALLLGFLPGTALIIPAMQRLWQGRHGSEGRMQRFLLAWVIGYLVYLELLSSKPGTYMVQTMFPALALAVGGLVVASDGKVPKLHFLVWPPFAALFAVVLFALPYGVLKEWPDLWLWLPMTAVAVLFFVSSARGRSGDLSGWARTGVAALGLFAVTLIGGVLPSLERIWPAAQLAKAFETCKPAPRAMFGFNEPSAWFVAGGSRALSTPEGLKNIANGDVAAYAVIEQSWYDRNPRILKREEKRKIQPLACFNAVNIMRGCGVSLTVTGREDLVGCKPPPELACTVDFLMDSLSNGGFKVCD